MDILQYNLCIMNFLKYLNYYVAVFLLSRTENEEINQRKFYHLPRAGKTMIKWSVRDLFPF